ncbi:MAG: MerR family transcriptional regulator [Verrucomicrobiota bacterium]|nr:MerR family transcriptional regulator [Verrucomicrobiota bacterium]
MKPLRTIKLVARETGLSAHAIRVWERRYGAVRPERSGNNRRLYSEADIEKLRLLAQATAAGHSIGQIAQSTPAELRRLVREEVSVPSSSIGNTRREVHNSTGDLMVAALRAIERLDSADFRDLLDRAAVELGSPAMLQKFIAPLASEIGERWRKGDLNIAHEHFATGIITQFLTNFARPYPGGKALHLVIATPTGQLHELGAIVVAAAARSHGWRTTYLGSSLPMEEFIGAARRLEARAVALSIVFPPDDETLAADLLKLPKLLPKDCAVIVGGRSAGAYSKVLRSIKATEVDTLEGLFPILDSLQRTKKPAA